MINIAKARRETPGCEEVIHFENAGASPMPDPVYNAVTAHLASERALGGYEAERRAGDQLAVFYTEFAALLNAKPEEIAFVENATRAWDMAFYALPLGPGDRILTHGSEYVSNMLAYLQLARKTGIEIDVVPSDETGQIDVDALEKMVTSRTKLIAITHVPTQGGLVNPAAEVGAVARRHGLLYLLDACQSVGQLHVDVQEIGCHILTGTGRKYLRGPRGTGFMYIQRDLADRLEPPFVDLRAADWTGDMTFELTAGAQRFETWESHVAGRIGLAQAVRYARDIGLKAIETRVGALAEGLRAKLSEIPGITVHDQGARKCGLVTFASDKIAAPALADRLRKNGMMVSVSSVRHARLDLGARGTGPLVRASLHYFNTEDEIARFAAAVSEFSA